MGCASSSPLVNGGGPGGLVDSAKTTATEVMSSGENAMHEMSESVGQMKDTMVETVNGVADSITDVINDGMTKIPLKETMDSTNHLLEENLENLKNEMMSKTQSIGDETDKITDELIKDTEDVIRDAETGMVDIKNNAIEAIETVKSDLMEELNIKSPSHSVETIQTSAPEPEIERITNGNDDAGSPEATINELENLNKEEIDEMPSAPVESNMEPKVEEPADEKETTKKAEDELVVEDIKDENLLMVQRANGKTLQKSIAVQESDDFSGEEEEGEEEVDESSVEIEEVTNRSHKIGWDELQDECRSQQQDAARILAEERARKSRKERRRLERNKPKPVEKPEWEKLQEECHQQMALSCARGSSEESTPSKKSVKSGSPSIEMHLNEVFHEKSLDSTEAINNNEEGEIVEEEVVAEVNVDDEQTETDQADAILLSKSLSPSQDSDHEILDVIDEITESYDKESEEIVKAKAEAKHKGTLKVDDVTPEEVLKLDETPKEDSN